MTKIWEYAVRLRTWLANLFMAGLIVLPELLNAPEVLAVIPQGYQKYVFVAALLLNILMRPRPASIATDPEVMVRKELAKTDGPATVTVKAGTDARVVIDAPMRRK